jgi:hypothetical protein
LITHRGLSINILVGDQPPSLKVTDLTSVGKHSYCATQITFETPNAPWQDWDGNVHINAGTPSVGGASMGAGAEVAMGKDLDYNVDWSEW